VPANVQFGIHFGDILDGYQPKVGFPLNVCSLLLSSNTQLHNGGQDVCVCTSTSCMWLYCALQQQHSISRFMTCYILLLRW